MLRIVIAVIVALSCYSCWLYLKSENAMKEKIICAVAGRSGGHIIPALTYVNKYTKVHPEYSVLFFSTDAELDRSIVALYPYVYSYFPLRLGGFPGKRFWLYPLFALQCVRAFFISYKQLHRHRPDRVVSMGGYISFPVCLAARLLRIPLDLFELNAVPGRAILWLAPLARHIYVCFDQTKRYFNAKKVSLTEYPVRFNPEDRMPQASALVQLGLDTSKKTLLILGGSQGSRSINELIKNFFIAHPHLASHIQVIHQAGLRNDLALKEFYRSKGIQALVYDYDHNMQYSYCAADLIIARAGAGTLFEIGFFGKKAIIIPLEVSSTAHQVDNAYAMAALDEQRARYENHEPLFAVMRQADIEKHPECFYQSIMTALR